LLLTKNIPHPPAHRSPRPHSHSEQRYGSAYLVTSISLSLVSITVCYALISAGVDVAGLLEKVGLSVTSNSERFGTFALAYAAHKAGPLYKLNPVEGLA
jgi:hypothetical protein